MIICILGMTGVLMASSMIVAAPFVVHLCGKLYYQ